MSKLITQNIKLILGFVGLLFVAAATTFHRTFLKVEIDRLLAEIGALLLVLGVLHFTFELRLREEMLKEVCAAVLGHGRLHESGLADCLMNSRAVSEASHWEASNSLTIGIQYSPKFVEDFHWLIEKRITANKYTMIMLMDENSAAAQYLKDSKTGIADVLRGVSRIRQIIGKAAQGKTPYVRITTHTKVLRYSFVRTEESIWIKFYSNSNVRTTVPAIKVRAGTPLYSFFDADIERLGNDQ
jgi:hypothetical protein